MIFSVNYIHNIIVTDKLMLIDEKYKTELICIFQHIIFPEEVKAPLLDAELLLWEGIFPQLRHMLFIEMLLNLLKHMFADSSKLFKCWKKSYFDKGVENHLKQRPVKLFFIFVSF